MAKTGSRMLHGDEFFSRLPSRERYNTSKQGEASFRVLYYAGATGNVPFLWESRPGTPKHQLRDGPLPPLTPPPQYQSSPQANHQLQKKNSRILHSIFARVPSRKIMSATPSSYSFHTKSRSRSTVEFGLDEDECGPGATSPTSTLCFGPRGGSPSRKMKGYLYTIKSVKKVVRSIVGHSSN